MEAETISLRSCYQGSTPIVPILDIREPSAFRARRLAGSVNIPASILLERLFLLSDKDLPLALVAPAGDGAAMKQELCTRGWTAVGPCIADDETLWSLAAAAGHIETGPPCLQQWLFRPCTLLAQEADRVEHLLLTSHLHQMSVQLAGKQARQHPGTSEEGSEAALSQHPATPSYAPGQDAQESDTKQVLLRCLDIGCGSGRDLAWLGTRHSQLTLGSNGTLHPIASDLIENSNAGTSYFVTHMEPLCTNPTSTRSAADCCPSSAPHEKTYQKQQQQQQLSPGSSTSSGKCFQIQWHVCGVDSWPGSLDRAQQLFNAAGLTAASAALHCGCVNSLTGELESNVSGAGAARVARELDKCHATQAAANLPALVSPLPPWTVAHFDLLLCVRFLERSFLATLPSLLRVGGILLYSHFLDMAGTRSFGRPTGAKHVLAPGELAQWFSERGFEVLRDEWEVLPDGRELSLFMARKLSENAACGATLTS